MYSNRFHQESKAIIYLHYNWLIKLFTEKPNYQIQTSGYKLYLGVVITTYYILSYWNGPLHLMTSLTYMSYSVFSLLTCHRYWQCWQGCLIAHHLQCIWTSQWHPLLGKGSFQHWIFPNMSHQMTTAKWYSKY